MNRRTLFKCLTTSLLWPPPSLSAQGQGPSQLKEPVAIAHRTWADEQSGTGLWLSSDVASFITNEDAKKDFDRWLINPVGEVEDEYNLEQLLIPTDAPVLELGDEAVGFLVSQEKETGQYIVVRVENLIYKFVSMSATAGLYDFTNTVIRSVVERSEPGPITKGEDLLKQLPTSEEVESLGMTSLVYESTETHQPD